MANGDERNTPTEEQHQQRLIQLHAQILRGERDLEKDPIKTPEGRARYLAFTQQLAADGLSEPTDFFAAFSATQQASQVPAPPANELGGGILERFGFTPTVTTESGLQVPNPYAGSSLVEQLYGLGETAISFATGVPAMVRSGYNIAVEAPLKAIFTEEKFYDAMKEAVEDSERIMGTTIYTPRSEAGKNITATAGAPFLLYDKMTTAAGNYMGALLGGDITGGPNPEDLRAFRSVTSEIFDLRESNQPVPQELYQRARILNNSIQDAPPAEVNNAAIFANVSTKALLDFLPDMLMGGRTVLNNRRKVQDYRRIARENNIDISATTDEQLLSLPDVTDLYTASQRQRAERMGSLQEQLQVKERIARRVSDQLFELAKSEDAYFPQMQVKLLDGALADTITEISPEFAQTTIAKGRLREFSQMVRNPDFFSLEREGFIGVNRLHAFRQKLNSDIRKLPSENRDYNQNTEFAALTAMRDQIDNFMDDQLLADLVNGSPEALDKWREANSWYADYKNRFTEQSRGNRRDIAGRAVQRIVQNELTPEKVRNIILGAKNLGGNADAALIVKKLNDEFGNDSPAMDALRQEIFFDISAPLFREIPDVNKFLENYNKFKRENMTLIETLFQGNRLDDFNGLVNTVRAMQRTANQQGTTITRRTPSLSRYLAVNAFGHGIAQGQLKTAIAESFIRGPLRVVKKYTVGEKSDTRLIMQELYGVDVGATPFMSIKTFPYVSAVSTTREAEEAQTGESMPRIERFIQRRTATPEPPPSLLDSLIL
jgi:hypothetical protein